MKLKLFSGLMSMIGLMSSQAGASPRPLKVMKLTRFDPWTDEPQADQSLSNIRPDVAREVPRHGWWTQPQSSDSAAWHKLRAKTKRERKVTGRNPSSYAVRNLLQKVSAASAMLAAALITTGCSAMTLDPVDGLCWRSPDSRYTVCGNPITGTLTMKQTGNGWQEPLRYDPATQSFRGKLPDGSTAVYSGGVMRIEPALPVSAQK